MVNVGESMSRVVGCVALVSAMVIAVVGLPCLFAFGESLPEIRTPKAQTIPHINGPKVYGARPGHPFLYRIPSTGNRPWHFRPGICPPHSSSIGGLESSLADRKSTRL